MYHLPFLASYVFVNKEYKIFYHCAFFQKKILSIRGFFLFHSHTDGVLQKL